MGTACLAREPAQSGHLPITAATTETAHDLLLPPP